MEVEDLFKHTYVITTENSERVSYIKSHLDSNNIKFNFEVSPNYHIIDKNFPNRVSPTISVQRYMSLSSAARSLIEMAHISGFESICILEDDCYFMPGWKLEMEKFLKSVPNDWDFLNLGYIEDSKDLKTINNNVILVSGNYWGAHCTYYKNTTFKCFIDIYNSFYADCPHDWILIEMYKVYKCYTPAKKIIRQLSVTSGLSYNKDVNSKIFFKSQIHNTNND